LAVLEHKISCKEHYGYDLKIEIWKIELFVCSKLIILPILIKKIIEKSLSEKCIELLCNYFRFFGKHVTPLGHISLIPSQPVFALTP
jgi:hypothetical protein